MEKLDGKSLNIEEENIEKLKELFPNIITDGKIDFDMLRAILGKEVDESREKYQFTWSGKGKAIKIAQTPSTLTLRPMKEKSKDWTTTHNLYIEGDNLEVLKQLQKTYHGKIKMIYIDPPYNTGNDFIYKDNYRDSLHDYLTQTSQIQKTNPESGGRYHTNWLNMIYPRLMLARNLLSEDGVIFISIDDSEQENLKKICDEIFGHNNFVNTITVNMNSLSGVKMTHAILGRRYPAQKEYMYLYQKGLKTPVFNIEKKHKEEWDKEYNLIIPELKRGQYEEFADKNEDFINNILKDMRLISLAEYANNNSIELTDEWKWDNAYRIFGTKSNRPLAKRIKDLQFSQQIMAYKNNDGNIRYFRADFNRDARDPRIELVQAEANSSVFLSDNWTDISNDGGIAQEGGVVFPNGKKPLQLIERIVKATNDKNCIILDFFSGSATTAHAVMKCNYDDNGKRQFIMVQLPEITDENSEAFKDGYKTICDLGENRIRISGEKIKKEWEEKNKSEGMFAEEKEFPVDIGFKVFKLDSSNIEAWDNERELNNEGLLQYSNQVFKEGRSKEDILYEIMLKYGIFDREASEIDINGKTMYQVGKRYMIVCLEDNLTENDIRAIGDKKPNTVVFKESGFKDDNAKINAVYNLEKAGVKDIKCI